jgi:hypothetical protein
MLKKLIFTSFLLLTAAAVAIGANLPLLAPGGWDPTNGLGSLNSVVQSINNGVSGVVSVLPAPVSTSGTSIYTLQTITLANGLPVGQTFHIHVYGVNDSNADARTLTFSFGGSTCALTVTATSGTWMADFYVTSTGASTETSICSGQEVITNVQPVIATNWTINNAAAITVLIEGTAATAGTMTLDEAVADIMR